MEETQFSIKVSEEESKLIRDASKLVGLGHSSFTRMCAIERAREIIKKNG